MLFCAAPYWPVCTSQGYHHRLTACPAPIHRYIAQHAKHKDMLARFPRALATLASVPIHPAARTERLRSLIELVPQQALRDWATSCENAMQTLAARVSRCAAVAVSHDHGCAQLQAAVSLG